MSNNFNNQGVLPKQPGLFGNHRPILKYKNIVLFTIPPQWTNGFFCIVIISIISILLLIFSAHFRTIKAFFLMHLLAFIFLLLCYLLTVFINPGFAKMAANTNQENKSICSICKRQIEQRTMHCRICEICIQNYDHHCGFIGTCIGKNNTYLFYMFVLSNLLWILSAIALAITLSQSQEQ